ncbi:MAG: hypothetical protein U0L19_11480 [Bacteroidales bacterium]|nr:hypothetical protein [Bacteroidales bacterium]
MKQLTIIKRLPHGARFVQLPNDFKVIICIKNNVLKVDFVGMKSNASLCYSLAFIDADVYKSFDDFSKKGQKLLLERLREAIVSDICTFISGKYEGVSYPEEPYYSIGGCLDIDSYMAIWVGYYDIFSDDDDILAEYTDPEEETDD